MRNALLRVAVAHNRAVLAGTTIALAFAVGFAGLGLALPSLAGGAAGGVASLLALPLVAAGIVIGWRGVRLHRHILRDLGPARGAGAALAAALLARGGAAPAADLEAALGRETVERGLAFLARLRLAWAEEPEGGGGGGPRLAVDGARLLRLLPLLDAGPQSG